jgi:hypothetical protein
MVKYVNDKLYKNAQTGEQHMYIYKRPGRTYEKVNSYSTCAILRKTVQRSVRRVDDILKKI